MLFQKGGTMSCKTNISEKYFCTKIMRNFVINFTLKSFLHPLVQSHNSVHIFFPITSFFQHNSQARDQFPTAWIAQWEMRSHMETAQSLCTWTPSFHNQFCASSGPTTDNYFPLFFFFPWGVAIFPLGRSASYIINTCKPKGPESHPVSMIITSEIL